MAYEIPNAENSSVLVHYLWPPRAGGEFRRHPRRRNAAAAQNTPPPRALTLLKVAHWHVLVAGADSDAAIWKLPP